MEFPSAQSLQAELHRPSGAKERRHQDDKSLRNPIWRWAYTGIGLQDATCPRRGPSPPEAP